MINTARWKSLVMTILMMMTTTTMMSVADANPKSIAVGAKGECDDPVSLRRGVFQVSEDKSSIEYFCEPGHTLIGSSEATCQKGRWSPEPPVCVGRDCEMPVIKDALISSQHGGGVLRIRCRTGFVLRGESETLACVDGQWNATIPKCISDKIEAPSQKSKLFQLNSKLMGKHPKSEDKDDQKKTQQEWLAEADYSCVGGEAAVFPPSVANARAFTRWAMVEGRPRLYATYQCKWGYKPAPDAAKNLYCQERKWIGAIPKCHTVVYEERVQGDYSGFVPSMSHDELLMYADYSCLDRNSDVEHTVVEPPGLEHTSKKNLRFAILEGKPHLYVEYVCKAGFQMEREKHTHLYCKGRRWIGEKPKCIQSRSKESCTINNGGCDQLCGYDNDARSGRRVCSCKRGYLLQPDLISCADIDECLVNEGGCDHLCANKVGSFQCSCFPGYTLQSDGKTCAKAAARQG